MHKYQPEGKRKSSQWLEKAARGPLKIIRKLSLETLMCVVFWDRLGVILVKFIRAGTTLTSQVYCGILRELKTAYYRKRGKKRWDDGICILHENAPCHTSRPTTAEILDLEFFPMQHATYGPALAPSDYYLFPKLKRWQGGRQYTSVDQLQKAPQDGYHKSHHNSTEKALIRLVPMWNKSVDVKDDYVKK